MSSLQSSLTKPGGQHPLSTYRHIRPNLSCAPADREQRLSKQELVRQQIAQETFPNELEGLVPSPRAAALLACLARQRLALAGGPTLRGEQRSSAWVWHWQGFLLPIRFSLPARASSEERDACAYRGASSSIGALAKGDATGGAPSYVRWQTKVSREACFL